MDLKSTYNRIAEDWHKDHISDSWWMEGTDKFVSLLKTGAEVLDVGCGGGTKSKYLLDKGLRITGIDFSEGMIEIAKREVPRGKFYVMDMYNLSGLNKKFDGVFVQAALLHIPKARIHEVLTNLIGLLKKGGYLYVGVKETWVDHKEEEILRENDYGYDYERFFSYFTLYEIREHLVSLEMEVVYSSRITEGKTNWIQVIGKLP